MALTGGAGPKGMADLYQMQGASLESGPLRYNCDFMNSDLSLHKMDPSEETEVRRLVTRVFDEFVAPSYTEEGVQGFHQYVQSIALKTRSSEDHLVLVATQQSEIRRNEHISLLFVDALFQGKGIAEDIVQQAVAVCIQRRPELSEVSVNSSPNAVGFYEMLGFGPVGCQETRNGISSVPVALKLPEDSAGMTEQH